MIFINTRPVDEGTVGERRSSKTHHSEAAREHRKVHWTRLVICFILFYLLVSIFPASFLYPYSLAALFVPALVLLYAICRIREENRSDQWPAIFIAILGLLVKFASIAVYMMIFPSEEEKRHNGYQNSRVARLETTKQQYRIAFFVVVFCIEIFLLLIGIFLKWHLLAFDRLQREAKRRRSTLTSNRSLLSHDIMITRKSSNSINCSPMH